MKQAPSIFKPMFKMNFRTSQCHFFEILYTFFFFFFLEKPRYLWFLKWYVCLQCNSGPRRSALFIF